MSPMSNSESRKREAELAPTPDRVRLTDEERGAVAAKVRDSFYEARDQGRTMHQASEDERIFAAVESLLTARQTALRAQIAADIEARSIDHPAAAGSHYNAAIKDAARISRGDS